MEEKKIIDTIRNIEFFNSIFLYTKDASIILKYSKTIFSHLESWMLTLTNVVDFDHNNYLPTGVITALVGSLFGNLMKFINMYNRATKTLPYSDQIQKFYVIV